MKTDDNAAIVIGTFDSEKTWRDDGLCRLPHIADIQSEVITAAMDEALFTLCDNDDDILFTKFPVDGTFKEYLDECGFKFHTSSFENSLHGKADPSTPTCRLLARLCTGPDYWKPRENISKVRFFSVLDGAEGLLTSLGIEQRIPCLETVKKVNSKLFSQRIARDFFGFNSFVVHSTGELLNKGKSFLFSTAFLIKDEFGVSGKGTALVTSPEMLDVIGRYCTKQENAGKTVRFIIEPFLDKKTDFSCQLIIGEDGGVSVNSVHEMGNNGFSFSQIKAASTDLRKAIDKAGYYKKMEIIAEQLYLAGYFGPVCVDSMVCKDGTVIPLIEINARYSMGYLNSRIDAFCSRFSSSNTIATIDAGMRSTVQCREWLDALKKEGILFSPDNLQGILPLTMNTLTVNQALLRMDMARSFKGRMLFSIIAEEENRARLFSSLKKVFRDFGATIFN